MVLNQTKARARTPVISANVQAMAATPSEPNIVRSVRAWRAPSIVLEVARAITAIDCAAQMNDPTAMASNDRSRRDRRHITNDAIAANPKNPHRKD